MRNAAELRGLQRSLSGYTTHPITPTISFATRALLETFTLQVRLGMADAFIAATALELALPLYTLNVRHFQMIPGLAVMRPY